MIVSILNNTVSKWASQNIRKAQLLLFLSEVSRFLIAMFLGKPLLPRLGINEFFILGIILLGLVFILLQSKTKRSDFRVYAKKSLVLMSCSWILFFGLGSLFSKQSSVQNNATLASDIQI
jgi:CDP-diglyceride synthetase